MASPDVTAERFTVPDRAFRPHTHDEFVLSLNGPTVVCETVKLDRERFSVGAGAVTTYNPHQVQSSTTSTVGDVPWECASLYASQSAVAALAGPAGAFCSPVSADPRVALGIGRAVTTAGTEADEWALWTLSVAISPRPTASSEADATPLVLSARVLMERHLHGPVSLDHLCEQLGTRRDVVVRSFVRETGVPPYAWHLQRRLLEGQRLLRSGHKVADVAAELGFADQAHFHRLYRAAYARTPGADHRSA